MTTISSSIMAEFIQRRTGLDFSASRLRSLEDGVTRLLQRHGLSSSAVLLQRLETEPGLMDELVGEITVGETHFFRHPQQFAVIRERILPELVRAVPDRPLRIWSAGCATGEEPYTLAILATEMGIAARVRILATDLARNAIRAARAGRYRGWSLRGTPAEIVTKYFRDCGDEVELDPAIRELVEFRYLNLAEDVYPTLSSGAWQMDLVLCRNVLIYFDAGTAAAVGLRLLSSLSEAGWLLFGASDPFSGDDAGAAIIRTDAGLAYRRQVAPPRLPEPFPAAGGGHSRKPVTWAFPPAMPARSRAVAIPLPAAAAPDPLEEASARYAARDYEGAIARLDHGRRSAVPDAWVLLVRALANLGRLQDAARRCADAVEHHPASPELAYLEAVLLIELGCYADAVRSARRALYLDRSFVMAHLTLGSALVHLGDHVRARRAYRNAAALLEALPPGAAVPASDGETATRLLLLAQAQQDLLEAAA